MGRSTRQDPVFPPSPGPGTLREILSQNFLVVIFLPSISVS
jgi:hypothetical protein